MPLVGGLPDMAAAYESLIRPSRPAPKRPWTSPGLTDEVLRDAPAPGEVAPELERRVSGAYLVGHNVGVDWRLLHRRFPGIRPAGIIDTLKLAKRTTATSRSLTTLVDHYGSKEAGGRTGTGWAPAPGFVGHRRRRAAAPCPGRRAVAIPARSRNSGCRRR